MGPIPDWVSEQRSCLLAPEFTGLVGQLIGAGILNIHAERNILIGVRVSGSGRMLDLGRFTLDWGSMWSHLVQVEQTFAVKIHVDQVLTDLDRTLHNLSQTLLDLDSIWLDFGPLGLKFR